MLNVFLGSPGIPPWPGESQLTPFPMLPLPISIYPPPLLLTYSLLFYHHPTHIYTHQRRFCTPLVPHFYFIPALPPYPPHFALLVFSMAIPLLPAPSPTLKY